MMRNKAVIGRYEGKCCDSTVYNNNGMLLNRELFNVLVNSDDYKRAMQNRYYIGFLGHPEDPNCMDFEHGCVIMTDMQMHDDGEIFGTFDLIDTPVGQIVKTFIDAGVKFGISIRGAGDVDNNGKVDPETFVFRGFDLVTFPAYDDAVPEFREIAASSDIVAQSKYKKVCAAIKTNLPKIESAEALEVIQSQFDESSSEYKEIGNRIDEIESCSPEQDMIALLQQKLDAMTNLYLDQVCSNKCLSEENDQLKLQIVRVTAASEKEIRSIERIMGCQIDDMEREIEAAEHKYMTAISANSKLKDEHQQQISACSDLESKLQRSRNDVASYRKENDRLNRVLATTQTQLDDAQTELKSIKSSNLIYQRRIESTNQALANKDEIIASLKSERSETVTANQKLTQAASNRDDEIRRLRAKVQSSEQLIGDYQQAYADLCAGAIGVSVENIPITSSTSPQELKNYIFGSTSTSGVPASPSFAEPEQLERVDDYNEDDNTIVSL